MLNAKDAIAHHMQWRSTFLLAIACQDPLPEDLRQQIRDETRCKIGVWLDSRETLPIRKRPEYLDVVTRHRAFHREMDGVAKLIERGDFAAAKAAVGRDTTYEEASQMLASAIVTLNRAAPMSTS